MGHGYSSGKFKSLHKSTPQDVRENLEWTLDETSVWEDGSRMVYSMLAGHQKELKESTEHLKSPDFDFESCRLTLDDIDNLISERKKSAGILESSKSQHRTGSLLDTKTTKETHQRSGFGAGRIPEVRISSSSAPAAISSTSTVSPMEEIRNVEVTAPSSTLFRKVAIDEAARRSKNVGKPSASSAPALTAEEEKLRNEIGAKYLYIEQLLYRMQQSAQYCYKLHRRHFDTTKRLQSRKLEKLPQIQQLSLHKSHDETSLALENGLRNFDNARNAIAWLYSDYELQIGIFRCRHQLFLAQKAREIQGQGAANVTLNTSLDQMIYQLQERYSQLKLEVQQNELYCIVVALSFYDRGQKGYLVPQDVPEMSASLFSLLDVNNDRCISPEDLQKSILMLNDRITSLRAKINTLTEDNEILHMKERSELNTMRMIENADKLTRLRNEEDEDNKTLKSIFRYFHTGFARFVFNKLESEVSKENCDSDSLLAQIEAVDMSAKVDPLEMDVADKAKFHRELQRSLWVDRMDELHAVSSPIPGEIRGAEAEKMARAGLGIESQERERGEIAILQARAREQEAGQHRATLHKNAEDLPQKQQYTEQPVQTQKEQQELPEQQRSEKFNDAYAPAQGRIQPSVRREEQYSSTESRRELPEQQRSEQVKETYAPEREKAQPMQPSVPEQQRSEQLKKETYASEREKVQPQFQKPEPYTYTEPIGHERQQIPAEKFQRGVPYLSTQRGGDYEEPHLQERGTQTTTAPTEHPVQGVAAYEPAIKRKQYKEPLLQERLQEETIPAMEPQAQERGRAPATTAAERSPVRIHQQPEIYSETSPTVSGDTRPQTYAQPEQEYETEKPGFFGRLLGMGRKEVETQPADIQYKARTEPLYQSQPQYHPEEAEELVTKGYGQPSKSDIYSKPFTAGTGTEASQRSIQPEDQSLYEKARTEMQEETQSSENVGNKSSEGVRTIY